MTHLVFVVRGSVYFKKIIKVFQKNSEFYSSSNRLFEFRITSKKAQQSMSCGPAGVLLNYTSCVTHYMPRCPLSKLGNCSLL